MKVKLSAKGERMVSQLNEAYVKIHEEILENIDVTNHDNLIHGMSQLLTALRKWMTRGI